MSAVQADPKEASGSDPSTLAPSGGDIFYDTMGRSVNNDGWFKTYIIDRFLLDDREGTVGKILDGFTLKFKDPKMEEQYQSLYNQAIIQFNRTLLGVAFVFGILLLLFGVVSGRTRDEKYLVSEGFRVAGLLMFLAWTVLAGRIPLTRQQWIVPYAYAGFFVSSCCYKVRSAGDMIVEH
jgi:hypothetical protein